MPIKVEEVFELPDQSYHHRNLLFPTDHLERLLSLVSWSRKAMWALPELRNCKKKFPHPQWPYHFLFASSGPVYTFFLLKLSCCDIIMWPVKCLCCTPAVGRLCELTETAASERSRQSCSEIRPYVATLLLNASCNSRQPGTLVWTPDESTPDVVYYQVRWLAPRWMIGQAIYKP